VVGETKTDGAPTTRRSSSGWSVFRRVMSEMRGYRGHLVGIAVLGVVVAPLSLLQPLALGVTVDSYLGDQPLYPVLQTFMPDVLAGMDGRLGYLLFAAGLVLFAAVANQAMGFTKRLLTTYTRERLILALRMRLFGHVERLSLSYHDQEGPSESTFRIMMDTAVIPGLLLQGLIPSLQALALVLAISTAIVWLSAKLAFFVFLIAPVLLLISWPFGKSLRRQWHEIKALDTSMLGRLQELFSAVRLVKAFGKEQRETDQLLELAEKGLWAKFRVTVTQGKFSAITSICTALGTIGFLIIGSRMVKGGELQLGELIMLGALMVQFYSPLQLLVGQIASMQSALASAERALMLLDQPQEVEDRPDARPMTRAGGVVTFRRVGFGYEEGQHVLRDVSFEVEQGTRVGIAGRTGAGKTTLMNLLTRLYDPTTGTILLDGIDLRDIKLDDLRQQFAVVLQDPVLFKKSVAENINYAVPGATMEETVEAARLANVHDFIMSMPDGYDTIVGERGQRLSGGERQRISLARAFLKDAPILILDEPTSSVDMHTEAAIMGALERLMKGRTTFIIAHRPSTLEICDKVLVLQEGKVVAYAAPDSVTSLDELMLTTSAVEGNGQGTTALRSDSRVSP